MPKRFPSYFHTAIVFSAILVSQALGFTDPLDVSALQDMYKALNNPPGLKGWRLDGGDPCEESWTGVSCYGSSVVHLKIPKLNLRGYLGGQLYNLHNLKHMDVSSNYIQGEIPNGLPPNATDINLAWNNLSQSIPISLPIMKFLRHLNLSHNSLSGPIGNVFTGLENLKVIDLSDNNFTGDLPSSFGSLKNLTRLFLQNNQFTGSVVYLADLPLIYLNIQGNHFSGVIPRHFQSIPNLWIDGNKFHIDANYPPWDFPLDKLPFDQNFTAPPTTGSSAIENYPSLAVGGQKKKLSTEAVASIVGGIALVAACAALFIAILINQSVVPDLSRLRGRNRALHSLTLISSARAKGNPQILAVSSPPIVGTMGMPPILHTRTLKWPRRKSYSEFPASGNLYTVSDLQSATNSFNEENLLGVGSLGSVYKAELPDGQILAVKKINLVSLSFQEEDQFLDVIQTASQLRHPNIITLLGYCVEQEQHLLVYEYVRNLSLEDVLHDKAYKPLSWGIRIRIALGVARALDYLHTTFLPPLAHCNIKAANILLDEEFTPRLCDCGLAVLRPLTSNSVKLKASEIAIGDTGYRAPDHGRPGLIDNTKSDVYAFGVLLLELLTGRKPFDCSRPREEQSLVKWASSRLHDGDGLEEMVDPGIKRSLSSKVLSRYADIVSLCIQPEKEFRAPISEIVESLGPLQQRVFTANSCRPDRTELDPFDLSFRSASTHTRFVASPQN